MINKHSEYFAGMSKLIRESLRNDRCCLLALKISQRYSFITYKYCLLLIFILD